MARQYGKVEKVTEEMKLKYRVIERFRGKYSNASMCTVFSVSRSGYYRIVPITPNTITDHFIRLRNRLNLNIRLHDLRHYNASVMLALNVPDKYAMRRGGWTTPATMKKVYQHVFREKTEQVDDTVNTFFDELLDGEDKPEE